MDFAPTLCSAISSRQITCVHGTLLCTMHRAPVCMAPFSAPCTVRLCAWHPGLHHAPCPCVHGTLNCIMHCANVCIWYPALNHTPCTFVHVPCSVTIGKTMEDDGAIASIISVSPGTSTNHASLRTNPTLGYVGWYSALNDRMLCQMM